VKVYLVTITEPMRKIANENYYGLGRDCFNNYTSADIIEVMLSWVKYDDGFFKLDKSGSIFHSAHSCRGKISSI